MAITALRVSAVIVYSADPRRSRAFYEQLLGLSLEDRTSEQPDPHWGLFVQKVYFAIQERPLKSKTVQRVSFSFEVEDIDALVEKLRCARVPVSVEPSTRPYGRIAGVLDPDGNLVYLHELAPASTAGNGVQSAGIRTK